MDQKINDKGNPSVIGIGASAGGLESIEDFFKFVPEGTGHSFIVIQHLSPDFKSFMPEILSCRTKLPVKLIEDDTDVEANTVYLLPPKKNVAFKNNRLTLTDIERSRVPNKPIDQFLESLASQMKERAIAVILSGSGSDGAKGILSIEKLGGKVFAESPKSAKFDSMPDSAIATGVVDFVGTPAEIAGKICGHLGSYDLNRPKYAIPELDSHEGARYNIFRQIQDAYGVDFSLYKATTVSRRMDNRIQGLGLKDLDEYLKYIQNDSSEIANLYYEILIGVTAFFRDDEAFRRLKEKVIPRIVDSKEDGESIRVWSAGCASGEEVYSIITLFLDEIKNKKRNLEIKAFASDIDDEILQVGADGKYQGDHLQGIPAEFLKIYFTRSNEMVQVTPMIRRHVVFARHNLLRDPPFNRMDLISCRNLLIYFGEEAQRKALSTFYFSLVEDGFLFLGPSETLGRYEGGYGVVDRKWKIYQKRPGALTSDLQFPLTIPRRSYPQPYSQGLHESPRSSNVPNKSFAIAQETLLQTYVPSSVLINEQMDMLHYFGDLSAFLSPKADMPSMNLRQMVEERVASSISLSLQRCKKEKMDVAYRGLRLNREGKSSLWDIFVRPVQNQKDGRLYLFLVSFESDSRQEERPLKELGFNEAHNDQINILQQELQESRENLQTTIEELETTNEELQSTNEELLASNEELQSTNEELHSVNEELHTVNSEYQQKIEQLTQITQDEQNMFKATRIGVVFLDSSLRIRKYTPAAGEIFNLLDQDLGRPFAHIAHPLDTDLIPPMRSVATNGSTMEMEVRSPSKVYLLKIMPYMEGEIARDGIVLTLMDATNMMKALEELEQQKVALKDQRIAALNIAKDAEEVSRILKQRTIELEQSNSELEQFAFIASHDLQAPLRHVRNYSHELQDILGSSLDSESKECVEGIVRGCQEMNQLIQALLELAKIGRRSIQLEELSFKSECDHLQHLFSKQLEDLGVTLSCFGDFSFSADQTLLRQLLQNLVENAIKFRKADGQHKVDLHGSRTPQEVMIRVKDNGIGIEPAMLDRIFDVFQRAHTKDKYEGTGIGLSVCKKIAAIHKGTITIESYTNGTEFVLKFPQGREFNE